MTTTNIAFFESTTWEYIRQSSTVVATSGGFDPLHVGHIRCITNSKPRAAIAWVSKGISVPRIITLVVIVNGTNFLLKKKGYEFMPLQERMEMVSGVQDVDLVVAWDQKGNDTTVCKALEIIRPDYFAKGGDRGPTNTPEANICNAIGCEILYEVGGTKIQSSSQLTDRQKRILKQNENY